MDELTPILGGWCVKRVDETHCVDVLKMLYNYRVVLTSHRPTDDSPHMLTEHGFCYFGHGTNNEGTPRTMFTALLAATAAAFAWDGQGEPEGYDKKAF